ncbi:hypothetical protein CRENBAI_011121 [Crenichthys baileyi]|uniref:Uncharacterized protein n=1 Tax=Crenichthys baileyi TaxID=28760 RepID=A0AAV9SJ12_9TELE
MGLFWVGGTGPKSKEKDKSRMGCVFNTLHYTFRTYTCRPRHHNTTIDKFADDITVVELIFAGEQSSTEQAPLVTDDGATVTIESSLITIKVACLISLSSRDVSLLDILPPQYTTV